MFDNVSVLSVLSLAIYGFFATSFYLKKTNTIANRIIGSLMMGMILAILAYHFVPNYNYDLVVHQEMAKQFSTVNSLGDFLHVAKDWDIETLSKVYALIISKIGDYNLMQTIPALIGYSSLFFMLIDYKEKIKLSAKKLLILIPFVIFGQYILFTFSGIFNYLAICVFSLGVYIDYIVKNKTVSWLLYALSIFIHSSMLLPFAIMTFLKIKKNKITKKTLLLIAIAMMSFNSIVAFIANTIDSEYLTNIKNTLDVYMRNTPYLLSLYGGFYLFMSITKIITVLWACLAQRINKNNKPIRNLVLLISISTIILSIMSIAMTRFTSLMLFLSIPMLMDIMNEKNSKSSVITIIIVCILSICYSLYSIMAITPFISFS